MESASPARYRASLYRAEEGTIMGTISPRVRRSAACTASRIFLRSSSENIFISPAPGGAPAAETSPASAETAAESASARKLAETSSSPAAESPWRTSAAARHPCQPHRDDQHDERGDDGQDQAGREGAHEGHHASDGAAFPMVADDGGCQDTHDDGQEQHAQAAFGLVACRNGFSLGRSVWAFDRAEHGLDAGRDPAGEIAVPEARNYLFPDAPGRFQIGQRPFQTVAH